MRNTQNKRACFKFFISFCFIVLSSPFIFSQGADGSMQIGSASFRSASMELFTSEISQAARNEIAADSLGVWYDVLESALFMLIRYNEIYRGKMRLLITDTIKVECKIYPDGTVLVSTGLFDYIDAKLAKIQNASPRRIKNFNKERENLLAAFLAHEAAAFALDVRNPYFADYMSLKQQNVSILKDCNLKADKFAAVFLRTAGYSAHLFYDYLEELKNIQSDTELFIRFETIFQDNYSPDERVGNFLKTLDEAEVISDEIMYILDALKNDRNNLIEDAAQRVKTLKNNFYDSIYFKRLTAIVTHKKLEATTQHSNNFLLPVYPISMQSCSGLNIMLEYIKNVVAENKKNYSEVLRDSPEFYETILAYKMYLNSIYESGLASSYAFLLSHSQNSNERTLALETAEAAYLMEYNSNSLTAAVNYASVLYITGKDYTKAKMILEDILNNKKDDTDKMFLAAGLNVDERFVLYNYIILISGLNEREKALKEIEKLNAMLAYFDAYTPIALKKIKIGDTADDLLEYWGKPSEIKYNYISEIWNYNAFNATVFLSASANMRIEKIVLFQDSNLSLLKDLRVGESKKYFEKVFGKSLYKAGDFEVYFYKANTVKIFYLGNYARQIILTKEQSFR